MGFILTDRAGGCQRSGGVRGVQGFRVPRFQQSPITWWLLFFFPAPDLVFYAAGLTSAPLRLLLIAVLSGRGLGLFLANFSGYWTTRLSPEWLMVKWMLILTLGLLIYWRQRTLRLHALLAVRRLRRWRRLASTAARRRN